MKLILGLLLLITIRTTAQTTETYDINKGIPRVDIQLLYSGPITDTDKEAQVQFTNANGSNYTSDELFNGYSTIHLHGNSTANDPKQSYNLGLADAGWSDLDFPLLNMPADHSWVLIANYNDKSLIRNSLALYLGYAIGMEWTPRFRFVEAYLNGSYIGLYLLTEKVSHSANRVNIQKIHNDTYPEITGGYIIEVTPSRRVQPDDSFFVSGHTQKTFVIDYPKNGDITPAEIDYIHKYTDSFETALFGTNFKDPTTGYAKYIDVNTFVDWYVVEELAKNQDAKMYASCFFYKDKLGKLKAGPLWDFDLSFGNRNQNGGDKEDSLFVSTGPYYKRLFQDPAFVAKVQNRWSELRHIFDSIPTLVSNISNALIQTGAIDRNFAKWPELGINVGFNSPPYPHTYTGEIRRLSDWARQRDEWLNIYLQSTTQAQCDSIKATKPVISVIGTDEYEDGLPFEARTLRGFSAYYWDAGAATKSYDTTLSIPHKHWLKMSVNGCTTLLSDTLYAGIHIAAPVATAATQLTTNSFIANWNNVTNATSYSLDVSTSPTFLTSGSSTTVTEGFDNGKTPPAGWTFSKGLPIDALHYGIAAPAIKFTKTGQSVTTAIYPASATKLSFFIRGLTSNAGSLLVEGSDGLIWKTIDNITNISRTKPNNGIIKTYQSGSSGWQNNFVRFRFTYTTVNGAVDFDDVSVTYGGLGSPLYVTGYGHLAVNGTSQLVNGLTANTAYYFRVRSFTSNDSSDYSNVISATTCSSSSVVVSNIAITNVACNGSSTGAIDVTASGSGLAYSWTGPNNFAATSEDLSNIPAGTYNLAITTDGGCGLDTTVIITEPAAPVTAIATIQHPIACIGDTTSIIVSANGGVGGYSYTLSDGINVQGPQTDSLFIVHTATYTITVTDANNCTWDTIITVADGTHSCEFQFAAGNLIVLQTTGTVSKASSAITLNEFTPDGAAGISVSLPATGVTPIQTSGVFGGSEGFLTNSTDNKYILLGGYGTSASFSDITSTASSAVPRVIGTVSSSGVYQQVASSSTAYSGNDIRGAISDGINYWASGASVANVDGVDYYGPGAFAGLGTAATPPKAYGLHIFNGQIYYSTEKSGPNNSSTQLGIFALGTGLPTTNPVTITQVINTTTSTLEDFSFNSDMSVCYIANNTSSAAGGIQKWTQSGGVWTLAYTLGTGMANNGAYGLVVDYSGTDPVIYATTNEATGNRIIKIVDAGSGSAATTIVAAQSGVYYKGITFAPVESNTPIVKTSSIISKDKTSNPQTEALKVDIFPNPASDQFALKVQSNSNEKISFVVTDAYGKSVYQGAVNNNERYLFGRQFSSGIYFIKITQGKNVKRLKLIKQN